ATENIGHMQVDLRPVERSLPCADDIVDAVALERGLELRLGEVPFLVIAELVVGASREFGPRLEPDEAVEVLHVVDARVELRRNLLLRAEDVRVVLGDVADTGQTVDRPSQLVSV